MEKFNVSERRPWKILEQQMRAQRYVEVINRFDEILRKLVIHYAKLYGTYKYRKITG